MPTNRFYESVLKHQMLTFYLTVNYNKKGERLKIFAEFIPKKEIFRKIFELNKVNVVIFTILIT